MRMKILSSDQIREIDRYTIENEPVASIDLMERAAAAFTHRFMQYFSTAFPVKIFCGIGNNGGDGLVIARLLMQYHYRVKVYIIRYSNKTSEDFDINFKRLKKHGNTFFDMAEGDEMPAIQGNEVVIDAMWGSGLSREVEGYAADVILHINENAAAIVAVDMPSGVFADKKSTGVAVEAAFTLSFQLPKLAFFFPENYKFVGEWEILDIGLSRKAIEEAETDIFFITTEQIKNTFRHRHKFTHKGTYGHALIIGGSEGKMGAAVLAATACLKAGAGMVTTYIPAGGLEIMQISLPEAMAITDQNQKMITFFDMDVEKFDVMGGGIGLGTDEKTQKAFHQIVKKSKGPMVIDADGLNILAKNKEWLKDVPEKSILTPHPKEFERLAGKWDNDFDKLEVQKSFSKKYNIYLVLKGAHTCITTPDGRTFFNMTGNAGMATAGSGDVLTGILTALLAQGYEPEDAAILGVYLHALAGDFAEKDLSMESMTSMDLTKYLKNAFTFIAGEA